MLKNLSANIGDSRDIGLIPGSGRSSGEGNVNPFQYSCLGNLMDRGSWRLTVHGVTEESDMPQRLKQQTKDDNLATQDCCEE